MVFYYSIAETIATKVKERTMPQRPKLRGEEYLDQLSGAEYYAGVHFYNIFTNMVEGLSPYRALKIAFIAMLPFDSLLLAGVQDDLSYDHSLWFYVAFFALIVLAGYLVMAVMAILTWRREYNDSRELLQEGIDRDEFMRKALKKLLDTDPTLRKRIKRHFGALVLKQITD